MADLLIIWTVYNTNTRDFPGQYVVREFEGGRATDRHYADADLNAVYEWIKQRSAQFNQGNLHRLPRESADDAVILESWV